MRPIQLFARFSLTALAAASIAATPASANDDIVFVSGTGEAAYAEYAAIPVTSVESRDTASPTKNAPKKNTQADMLAMADKFSDPDMQDGVAHMAERLGETMLRLPIGKFASAIEKARPGTVRKRVREDATLADLAGRNAQDIPAMIGKESRAAMKMMSGFTKAFAGMMPEFEKLGREMETAMADIKVKRR